MTLNGNTLNLSLKCAKKAQIDGGVTDNYGDDNNTKITSKIVLD